ncbi:MAG: hypothetical protein QM783_04690 [Phycisphaerales bacterium]
MNIRTSVVGVLAVAGLGTAAFGQCGFDVSLWQGFRAGQATESGAKQYAGDAFSFRRDGVSGPLLVAVHNSVEMPFSWGDPSQPYNVPQAGVIFSADPDLSQNPFHDREPQFTGIMMHPGYGEISCTAIFTAQTPVRVSTFHLYTEVLGDGSNGVQVTLQRVTAGGDVVPVGGVVTSQWGEDAHHTSVTPIVPVQMQPGDRVVVTTSNNGNPTEDWENVEVVLHVSNSAPVILAQPRRIAACPGGGVTLSVVAAGAESYQWQRGTVDLPGQDGETLTLNGLTDQDSAVPVHREQLVRDEHLGVRIGAGAHGRHRRCGRA